MADLSRNNTLHWCGSSMGNFGTEDLLKTHKINCLAVETTGQVLRLPEVNRKLMFENEPYAFPDITNCHLNSNDIRN